MDVVRLVGGLSPDADRNHIRLAAIIINEDSIVIVCNHTSSNDNQSTGNYGEDQVKYPINIITATQENLMALPGIGKTKAQEIIRSRQENGFFRQQRIL